MDWQDDAIVLAARRHGENAAIVQLLTREHGRHAGLVRGGASSRHRGSLQPGNRLAVVWRARMADHLGSFVCECLRSHAAGWLDDPVRLAAIGSACAVAEAALPEREPHAALYEGMAALLDCLESEVWPAAYIRWEIELLRELGYGLDLAACAATGVETDLAYVSPRTGRAVSRQAGRPYADRLLSLPGFLVGSGRLDAADLRGGLDLTAFFLRRNVFAPQDRDLPAARIRLAELLGGATVPPHTPEGAA